MKIAIAILFSLSIVIIVSDIFVGVRGDYEYENSVSSYWNIADKTSTIQKKAEYIDKFVAALEAQHFDGKYNAIIFPTPDNSFDRNFEALKSLQIRLHEVEKMDVSSFQYQTAIQQITAQEQGEAKPILDVFYGIWWKEHHVLLWDWILGLNVALIVILSGAGITLCIINSDIY